MHAFKARKAISRPADRSSNAPEDPRRRPRPEGSYSGVVRLFAASNLTAALRPRSRLQAKEKRHKELPLSHNLQSSGQHLAHINTS